VWSAHVSTWASNTLNAFDKYISGACRRLEL
jgi:hypothetical protein